MSNEEFSGLLEKISVDQLRETLQKLSLDRLNEIQGIIIEVTDQKVTNQDKTSQSNSVEGFIPTRIEKIQINVSIPPATSQPKPKEFCEKLKDIEQTELENALQTVSIDRLEKLRTVVQGVIGEKQDPKGLRKEASPC